MFWLVVFNQTHATDIIERVSYGMLNKQVYYERAYIIWDLSMFWQSSYYSCVRYTLY